MSKYTYTAVVPTRSGALSPSRRVRVALAALRHTDAVKALQPFLDDQVTPDMKTRRIVLEAEEWAFVDDLLHCLSLSNRSVLIRALLRYYDHVLSDVSKHPDEQYRNEDDKTSQGHPEEGGE